MNPNPNNCPPHCGRVPAVVRTTCRQSAICLICRRSSSAPCRAPDRRRRPIFLLGHPDRACRPVGMHRAPPIRTCDLMSFGPHPANGQADAELSCPAVAVALVTRNWAQFRPARPWRSTPPVAWVERGSQAPTAGCVSVTVRSSARRRPVVKRQLDRWLAPCLSRTAYCRGIRRWTS
jgi:hypothetical protein